MVTIIRIPCTNDTMGDTTDADCDTYRAWFAEQLESEYPGANITVEEHGNRIAIETDDESDTSDLVAELREFSNRCWDSCPWDFVSAESVRAAP